MSLINEALKRAKQAPPPAAPELPLRPVETPVPAAGRTTGALPIVLGVIGLLALLLVWEVSRHNGAVSPTGEMVVSAKSTAAVETAPVQASVAPETNAPARPEPPAPPPAPVPALAPVTNTNALAAAADTNAAVAVPAAPELPPLKLQGIVYSPQRPSVVISGRTLFIGDRIREFRVMAITAQSVTLSGNGQTKVLELPD